MENNEVYDDCSWNPHSCGSEYFDYINNSQESTKSQNIKQEPAASSLEVAVKAN